jgi:hypothetical protein
MSMAYLPYNRYTCALECLHLQEYVYHLPVLLCKVAYTNSVVFLLLKFPFKSVYNYLLGSLCARD